MRWNFLKYAIRIIPRKLVSKFMYLYVNKMLCIIGEFFFFLIITICLYWKSKYHYKSRGANNIVDRTEKG